MRSWVKSTLKNSSRMAHPGIGRFAALQILAIASPCLRLMCLFALRFIPNPGARHRGAYSAYLQDSINKKWSALYGLRCNAGLTFLISRRMSRR